METQASERGVQGDERLGKCEVCAAASAKYRCPRCEVRSCGLRCLNIHKKELECDGVRDPTKFITLDNFTNVDLLNDYRLLEKVGRVVEGLHRNRPPCDYKAGKRLFPKVVNILKPALCERKTIVNFLPKNFQRRLTNKTYFNKHKEKIFWTVEWIFPNADNLTIVEHNCPEDVKLSSVLHKYLTQESYSGRLGYYQAAGSSSLTLLLRAEMVTGEKYYELDPDVTLRENLTGKVLIEYPRVSVALKGHEAAFEVLEADSEGLEDAGAVVEEPAAKRPCPANQADLVLAQLLNEEAKQHSKTSKNLLFITEYSDTDLSSSEEV